jgi:CBS-domain-containing membrane protein
MKVGDLMTRDVKTCRPEDDSSRAAQILWEHDCGILPMTDADHGVVGLITDRDLAMAAYTKGLPLAAIRVGSVITGEVFGCAPTDSVESAMGAMRRWRVRRLPVLDRKGRILGILSLADIAREAERQQHEGLPTLSMAEVVKTLATITQPWKDVPPQLAPRASTKRAPSRVGALRARQADPEC